MIDPLIISNANIRIFKKKFGLKNIENKCSDVYFLRKRLLKYSINATQKDITKIFKGRDSSYVIVTGFGLTGGMHLGGKLLLNECAFFSSSGLDTYVFLSKADALSKRIPSTFFFKIKDKVLTKIEKLKFYKNFKVKDDKISNKIIKKISGGDIRKDLIGAYNFYPKNAEIMALISMVGSIYSIHTKYNNNKKIVVLLGIDEIYHACFIINRFKTLGIASPIFLFNDLIIGYDGKKMGKTRSMNSLVITNSYEYEYSKLEHFLKKKHRPDKCPAIEIARFSEYYLKIRKICSGALHKNIKYIIKQECSN